jgi:hypothetical protein
VPGVLGGPPRGDRYPGCAANELRAVKFFLDHDVPAEVGRVLRVSASAQAGRTSGPFKGIGTGHRKGVGSIVNVVDSSAWLEYLVDSERASLFAQPIEQTQELIVPVLVIYELFKKVLRERGEQPALEIYGLLS